MFDLEDLLEDGEGSGEATGETGADGGAPGGGGATVSDWNGEVDSLEKEPWWSDVPESARERVKAGFRLKSGNMERAFTRRTTDHANEVSAFRAAREAESAAARRISNVLYGDESYIEQLQQKANETDQLVKEAREAAIAETTTRLQDEFEAERKKWAESAPHSKERDDALAEMRRIQGEHQAASKELEELRERADQLNAELVNVRYKAVENMINEIVEDKEIAAKVMSNTSLLRALMESAPNEAEALPWAIERAAEMQGYKRPSNGMDMMHRAGSGFSPGTGGDRKGETLAEVTARQLREAEEYDRNHPQL